MLKDLERMIVICIDYFSYNFIGKYGNL